MPKHDISESQKCGMRRGKEKKLGGWVWETERARIGAREGEKGTDAEASLGLWYMTMFVNETRTQFTG